MKTQTKQAKQGKKKSSFDFGMLLLITGALANVTIWIGAFVSTEIQGLVSTWVREFLLPVLGGISGLSMGITVAAGLVYVLARLGKLKPRLEQKIRGKKDKYRSIPNVRFYTAWSAIILLLIISPALLAPYVFMTISGAENLYTVLGIVWARLWSVGRIVAADLALAAIALVYGVQFSAPGGNGRASHSAKSATQTTTKKPDSAKSATDSVAVRRTYPRKCEHCTEMLRTANSVGAHMKKHHPELCKPKTRLADVLFTQVDAP